MATLPADPPTPRLSVFREVGLDDEDDTTLFTSLPLQRPQLRVRFRSHNSIINPNGEDNADDSDDWESIDHVEGDDFDCQSDEDVDVITVQSRASLPYRLTLLALFVAIALPIVQSAPYLVSARDSLWRPWTTVNPSNNLQRREDSPTNICKRWSHQSAVVNGTLYMYGGRAMSDKSQTSDQWNNYFLSLDLTKTWQISDPALTGYPQPSGPPPVSNGFLWNSHDSLYLYGGEFSDTPITSPVPFSTWEYDIKAGNWVEHEDPKTSAGKNAEPEGQSVQRAAEGAGAGVAALGRGWYFGGHLDFLTTYEWSNQVARVYIKSLVEFTFPGYSNSAVDTISSSPAGDDGVWRNITQGGVQETGGFPERADGLLVYVPGFGAEGILLGLAGGDNQSFTQMNVIDVYDIANSTWYKQSTAGTTPGIRVNPCAVVAAAPDGSSYNMYMYGGQDLKANNSQQNQYDDMWILSMPSFTWFEVKTDSQVPPGRSGHTCNVWDGQLVLVGGYVGQDLLCDYPGIYVFNLTSLNWNNQFTALTGSDNINNKDAADFNPFSQQSNQLSHKSDSGTGGLEGSYGYQVPAQVYSAIGGNELGGATITKPVATATAGPFATGSPITYTVTNPDGSIVTSITGGGKSNNGGGTNVAAIVAGYFAFCAWIYRKQLQLYKTHAAMMQARNANEKDAFLPSGTSMIGGGAALGTALSKSSSERAQGLRPDSIANTVGSHSRTASSGNGIGAGTAYAGAGAGMGRGSMDSMEDLLADQEPSFWGTKGVLLNPRRSLRVINRD
ncbi:hypothetical protein EJ05DRAFT_541666 [Pseudovirgaria hyperparasitica]|uniref:Kelch repeat protein-like protein n=1 Tax=Pseudovirgaria hyperparasitica TaxID=470096 RepID=A0A6A6VUS9_9PEZI|nr:uncharacterized protein EJ05DRAFT_541666 [Pseudovirgaria hyperparasitica]KAF2753639.1 hypothetical protein EJ05DRAFT_541666 [Pseudovirgaria hyperparasitica]